MPDSKPGKGSRKIGRSAKSPSHQRYNAERRWLKNKRRRIAKQAKIEEKKQRKLNSLS